MKIVKLIIRKGYRKFYVCGECDIAYDDFAKSAAHQVTYKICIKCGADDWKTKVGKLSDCGSRVELREVSK